MTLLDLVVGPNGRDSPPSSTRPSYRCCHVVFVNADVIARQCWPCQAEQKSYEAALFAAATRDKLIDAGRPFIAETVFSHESKLELVDRAQRAGFVVVLHAILVPESLAVLRVARRTDAGGHSVPEAKIHARYQCLWPLVAVAISRADRATVYDTAAGTPTIVATFVAGVAVGAVRWPDWTPSALVQLA